MDLQPHSEPELTIVSTTNTQSAPYPGAFFPGSSGFSIHGGVFMSNNVYHPPQEQVSAFRTILLGDIKLIKELRLDDESRVVGRQTRGAGVRRMYCAKVMGGETGPMTVAMYQGAGAEEEWRQHRAKYESIRHPNIMQLYGLVTTGIHALVFHDELIPCHQFLGRFQYSPVLTTYIRGYCYTEWNEALAYCQSVFGTYKHCIYGALWIRPTTGELCVDLVPLTNMDDSLILDWGDTHVSRLEDLSLDSPDAEAIVISSFHQGDYHELCTVPPIAKRQLFSVSTRLPTDWLGSMISRSNSTWFRFTEPLRLGGYEDPLRWSNLAQTGQPVIVNSWRRFNSSRVHDRYMLVAVNEPYEVIACMSWLAQANHIFTQLQRTSHFEDFVYADSIRFILRCLPDTHNPHEPEGYLFVCPPEDFQTGQHSFQWPDCPAYWSFDPSGGARLSTEDAKILGFPILHIQTQVHGYSWDDIVYDGLRRFHRGKGFDPHSQEAAIHLGHPLYELLSVVTPLPCVDWEGCDFNDIGRCRELGHYL